MFPSVPTSPRSVSVESVGATSMLLSWRPPDPANGVILGYNVGHYKASRHQPTADNDMMIIAVDWPSARRCNVTGLQPYTNYQLQVLATTSIINKYVTVMALLTTAKAICSTWMPSILGSNCHPCRHCNARRPVDQGTQIWYLEIFFNA